MPPRKAGPASRKLPAKAPKPPAGRFRQRSRTRAHIVEATIGLLKAGTAAPTVSDVAVAAGVSRRTIYLHFPTLEHLLIDARLGMLSQTAIDQAIESVDVGGDAEARVARMIDAVNAMASETLPLGRALIRMTIEAPRTPGAPPRGYRRIGWIEKALSPLRGRLKPAAFERLVSALAIVIGWEALVVLQDVRGLSAGEQVRTSQWAARALIRAALQDAKKD